MRQRDCSGRESLGEFWIAEEPNADTWMDAVGCLAAILGVDEAEGVDGHRYPMRAQLLEERANLPRPLC